MKIILYILFFVVIVFESEAQSTKWFKGNLHTHSLWSDGDGYPDVIVDWYKTNGYQFIALSDHNILAAGDKWVKVPQSKMHEDGFQKYLERFGDDWVEQKTDSAGRMLVKLKTYEEYRKRFESKDFIMLKSEEITDRFEKKPIHINATNVQELIPAQGGVNVVDVMQRNINAVLEQRAKTGAPMFPHINHPNFYYAITTDDMIGLKGERFFEVYNGHPLVHNYGDSLHPGTEKMWDDINIAYRKRGQDLLFGLATDDSHNYHQFGKAYSNAGRGWVMVKSTALTPEALIMAMEAGDFYSSTGVVLEELKVEKNKVIIHVKAEKGVSYSIEFISADKNGIINRQVIKGDRATMLLKPDQLFLRAKITSSKLKENPFNEGEFETAWTQPVFYNPVR
jgi:hypothetical protein